MLNKELTMNNSCYKSIAKDRDDIIKEAVNKALGTRLWAYEDIKKRGQTISGGHGSEVFLFDGQPLIVFLPVEHVRSGDQLGLRLMYKGAKETNYKCRDRYV